MLAYALKPPSCARLYSPYGSSASTACSPISLSLHSIPQGKPLTGISPSEDLVLATASTSGGLDRSLSAGVALAGALDRLVHDLGRGLGLPVRVELQVVAFGVRVSAGVLFLSLLRASIDSSASSESVFRAALADGDAYPGARKGSIVMAQSALRAGVGTSLAASSRAGQWMALASAAHGPMHVCSHSLRRGDRALGV